MVLTTHPECPAGPYAAIQDSGLGRKKDSIFNARDDWYGGYKDLGNGFCLYRFYNQTSINYRKESYYLVGAMSRGKWEQYLQDTYKFYDELSYFVSGLDEVVGQVPGMFDSVIVGTFIANQILSLPKPKRRYINKQLESSRQQAPVGFKKSRCHSVPAISNKTIYIALTVKNQSQVYQSAWGWNNQSYWKVLTAKEYTAW